MLILRVIYVLAIAVALVFLVVAGVQAFYPEPSYPERWVYPLPPPDYDSPEYEEWQQQWNEAQEEYQQALEAYDRAMIETGIYRGRQVPVPGQEGEVEDYGWLEHSARRASTAARTELRRVLEQQGFDLK